MDEREESWPEFVIEVEGDAAKPRPLRDPTGWESVVFLVEDESPVSCISSGNS